MHEFLNTFVELKSRMTSTLKIYTCCLTFILMMSNLMAHEHLRGLDNLTICLGKSGDGITNHQYDMVNEYKYKIKMKSAELGAKRRGYDYALEASDRNLDWSKCKIILQSKKEKSSNLDILIKNESIVNRIDVKVRLKELKNLLNEGLISQEQYDEKSSKILEEF